MKPTLLMIDSGATNSNWKFMLNDQRVDTMKFKGFNLSTSHIHNFDFDIPDQYKGSVNHVFFFGAGTGDHDLEEQLRLKLQDLFPNLKSIKIGSDLLTAGLALSSGEKSVISILGTGSNCCVFDGVEIEKKVNNLGFIMGDEGSGFQMGRSILQDYFYNELSPQDSKLFESKYKLTRDELIRRVYHTKEKPNGYIASFCSFLIDASPSYRKVIARKNLDAFFQCQLSKFEATSELKHHFSGSISWYFQEEIQELCSKYEYKVGNIIQNPIDSLSYSKLLELI